MSLLQTERDIIPILIADWSKTGITYPNVKVDYVDADAYIELNIVTASAEQPATGTAVSRPARSTGDVVGSLFMPVGLTLYNNEKGSEIGEAFKNLLSFKRYGQTLLRVGRVIDAGMDTERGRYRYNIIIPYTTDTEETIT